MTAPNTLHLRYFAALREALCTSEEHCTSAAPHVGALRAELAARGGAWAQALTTGRAVRVAVNQVMADDDTPLTQDAEVAFFPPVTGG